jgi:hypothetical protein
MHEELILRNLKRLYVEQLEIIEPSSLPCLLC